MAGTRPEADIENGSNGQQRELDALEQAQRAFRLYANSSKQSRTLGGLKSHVERGFVGDC
jgi:hypothetical protein